MSPVVWLGIFASFALGVGGSACTRTGSQSAEQSSSGRSGSRGADSDRELPGYLVNADNGVDFAYFAPASGITAVSFPVVLQSHVVSSVEALPDVTVVSEPILLTSAEAGTELSDSVADRAFVEVCTRTTSDAASMGVIFPDEMLYFQALSSDSAQTCFSRMARLVLDKPYAFIRTTNGAVPTGYTLVEPAAEPTLPEATWAASGGSGSVTFGIAEGQEAYVHAISVIRDLPPVPTCAGGYSYLGAPGNSSISFGGQDASVTLAGRACAIDPDSGFGSPGVEFTLDPRSGTATSSSSSSTSTSSSGAPAGSHLMFVTSQSWNGNLGGGEGADAKCQAAALASSRAGTWKAIISVSASEEANTRITISGPVYNVDGEQLATGAASLWDGYLDNAVRFNEFGELASGSAWTGSSASGDVAETGGNCSLWFQGSGNTGRVGYAYNASTDWLSANTIACGTPLRLYCIDGQ